jgi:hypothetical protein
MAWPPTRQHPAPASRAPGSGQHPLQQYGPADQASRPSRTPGSTGRPTASASRRRPGRGRRPAGSRRRRAPDGLTPLWPPSWPTTVPPPWPAPSGMGSTSEYATTPGASPAPGVVARTKLLWNQPVSGTDGYPRGARGRGAHPTTDVSRNASHTTAVTCQQANAPGREGARDRGRSHLPWRVALERALADRQPLRRLALGKPSLGL